MSDDRARRQAWTLIALEGWICRYCYVEVSFDEGPQQLHVEHIIPLCRGGSWELENLCLSCRTCNLRKGRKDPIQWIRKLYDDGKPIPRGLFSLVAELAFERDLDLTNPYVLATRCCEPDDDPIPVGDSVRGYFAYMKAVA